MSRGRDLISSVTVGENSIEVAYVYLSRGGCWQVLLNWREPGDKPAGYRRGLQDYYDAHSAELAKAIAGEVEHLLRIHPSIEPDMRRVAADLKRRNPGLAPLKRLANGAVLLDSPADER